MLLTLGLIIIRFMIEIIKGELVSELWVVSCLNQDLQDFGICRIIGDRCVLSESLILADLSDYADYGIFVG